MEKERDRKGGTFKVFYRGDDKEVEGAFVLIPMYDSAARVALTAYAEATDKPHIARWLRAWLNEIHYKRMKNKENKDRRNELINYKHKSYNNNGSFPGGMGVGGYGSSDKK